MNFFRNLRFRAILILSFVIIMAVGVTSIVTIRVTQDTFQRYTQNDLLNFGRFVSPFVISRLQNFLTYRRLECDQSLANFLECKQTPVSDTFSLETLNNLQKLTEQTATLTGARIIVTDRAGKIITDSERGELFNLPPLQIKDISGTFQVNDETYIVYVYISETIGIPAAQNEFKNSINRSLIIVSVLSSLGAIIFVIILSREWSIPIGQLTKAARKLGSGDLSQRVVTENQDEIGELARAFNSMADSLERLEQLRTKMVTDIAHELRTPLSNIQGYLEAVQDGLIEFTPEIIASLHEEVMLLNRLVEDLQDLALAEAGRLQLRRGVYNISPIIERTLSALQPQIMDKKIKVTNQVPENLPYVYIDPERIGQVLRNLIHNSIKYSMEEGLITLTTKIEENKIHIIIHDNGIGIAPEHQPYIFERFYRADESRTRSTGGAGLGLAIVKQLVLAHQGEVSLHSTLNSGTEVTITLPTIQIETLSDTSNQKPEAGSAFPRVVT